MSPYDSFKTARSLACSGDHAGANAELLRAFHIVPQYVEQGFAGRTDADWLYWRATTYEHLCQTAAFVAQRTPAPVHETTLRSLRSAWKALEGDLALGGEREQELINATLAALR